MGFRPLREIVPCDRGKNTPVQGVSRHSGLRWKCEALLTFAYHPNILKPLTLTPSQFGNSGFSKAVLRRYPMRVIKTTSVALIPILFSVVTGFLIPKNQAAPAFPATRVVLKGLSQPQKLTLLAAQGLRNRTGPNVYLDFGTDNVWMEILYTEKPELKHFQSWNPVTPEAFKAKYPSMNEAWMEIWEKGGYFQFTSESWESFLAKAGNVAKGWIVYDDFESEVALVGTLAGQMDALPVLRQELPAMEKIVPGLPVVFDTKTIPDIPGVSRKVAVHRWMIENVLPKVNKTGLVSRVKNYGLPQHDTFVDIDQAVQEKWLVYDLTHYMDKNVGKPEPKYSKPEETEALEKILSAYPPLTPVFGWGGIDENTFVKAVTEKGLVVVCSGVPNNSFFDRWKASKLPLKQKHSHVADSEVKVEDKIYLAFMVNEGDSIKNAVALQGFGGWLQPERGSVPVNWGVDPVLFDRYSGLMEYFYTTATPNDYFFTAASGWGYTHPNRMTLEMAVNYVEQLNKGLKLTDTDYIDIWWMPQSGPVWDAFARGMNVKGLTQWYNPEQKVDFKKANFPVIYGNHHYTLNDPEAFARMLIEDYKDVKCPWFVIVYGANRHLTPYKAKAVMDLLPPERFKAVLLDEFFTAARASRHDIEGRVWRPGPNAPKGVAP